MTAITWSRAEAGVGQEGVQPFNAREHLRGVAELIGAVFADELDQHGQGALQEIQWVTRFSPLIGGLLSTAMFSDFVLGYVWVEQGRVVGNVTFQRHDMSGARWRISNVAVVPTHRQRGIARALMEATLDEITERGGHWSVLQVRVDNPSARHLYDGLGFTPVCQDGVWVLSPDRLSSALATLGSSAQAPGAPVRPLGVMHWRHRVELVRTARAQLAQWAAPVNVDDYRPGLGQMLSERLSEMVGLHSLKRWGIWADGRLQGMAEALVAGGPNPHQVRFEVRPEHRGELEPALLSSALQALTQAPARPIHVEHSGDDLRGVGLLETTGFRPQRVLLTMRRLMTAADAGY